MEDVATCRSCFCSEVRMYKFTEHSLDKYFLTVLGRNCTHFDELPQYLCYECAWLVTKFYHFREKCLRAQVSYVAMLQNGNELKLTNIKQLHGQNTSKLSFYRKPPNIFTYKHEDIEQKSNKYETDALSMSVELKIKVDNVSKTQKLDYSTSLYDSNEKNKIIIDDNQVFITTHTDFGDCSDDDGDGGDDDDRDKEMFAGTLPPVKESPSSDNDDRNDVIVDKKIEEIKQKLFKNKKPPESVRRTPHLNLRKIKQQLEALRTSRENTKRQVSDNEQNDSKPKSPKKGRRSAATGLTKEENALKEYVTIVTLSKEDQFAELSSRGDKEYPYKCDHCHRGYLQPDTYTKHMIKHDPKMGDVVCEICKFRFKTRVEMRKHYVRHTKKYMCKSCSHVTNHLGQAKEHRKFHQGVTYVCQHCGETTGVKSTHLSHLRLKHPSPHVCDECGHSYVNDKGLRLHKTMMHKHSEPSHVEVYCEECHIHFLSQRAFDRHLTASDRHVTAGRCPPAPRVCPPAPPAPPDREPQFTHHCTRCPQRFTSPRNLSLHWSHVHERRRRDSGLRLVCEDCGKIYKTALGFRRHRSCHSDAVGVECERCGKRFPSPTHRALHLRAHDSRRPHHCQLCDNRYKYRGDLVKHMRSHTEPEGSSLTRRHQPNGNHQTNRKPGDATSSVKD